MRAQQVKPNFFKSYIIESEASDSQSDIIAPYGIAMGANHWLAQLCKMLNADGCYTDYRSFGIAGNTTSQALGRNDVIWMYRQAFLGISYIGVNDPFGVATGTAQAGSATTITLANTSEKYYNSYLGSVIRITSGTGSGQSKTIVQYTGGSTYIATVDSAWSVNPNSTSVYSIDAPTQAQMQANQQAAIKTRKFRVLGYGAGTGTGSVLWNQSMLPANGFSGQRFVIMSDTSPTGGAAKLAPSDHATISGNYSSAPAQSVWEYRNPLAGEGGWGRVAITGQAPFEEGIKYNVVVSTNYRNWTTGGDSYNTNDGSGTQYEPLVSVRAATQTAAAAEGVVYANLFDLESKIIYGGNYEGVPVRNIAISQGDNKYHFTANNQHNSEYGHYLVALSVYLAIKNQQPTIIDLMKIK